MLFWLVGTDIFITRERGIFTSYFQVVAGYDAFKPLFLLHFLTAIVIINKHGVNKRQHKGK